MGNKKNASFLEQNSLKVIYRRYLVMYVENMQPEGWSKGIQTYPATTGVSLTQRWPKPRAELEGFLGSLTI